MKNELEQIDATLQLLTDQKIERLISLTYSTFFNVCPEAESLWEKDDPASREKMFNGIVLMIVDKLTRPVVFDNNLRSDVKDHEGYGVSKDMYGLFFTALFDALKETLGDDFNDAMASTWKHQLSQIKDSVHHCS